MRHIAALIALIIALPLVAAPADEVRAAETAFAKAFADRDSAKFFAFVADDATFMGAKRTLSGKPAVVAAWSEYFKDEKAPFRWNPERVAVNAAGDLGLSTGPVYDTTGKHTGNFVSTWQKQADGSWKVVFDGPGAPACK